MPASLLANCSIIDLTHTLSDAVPTWEGTCGFERIVHADYEDIDGGFRVLSYQILAGAGTHIDAPAHLLPDRATIDDLHLEDLIAPLRIIDVRDQVKQNDEYQLSPEDIAVHEAEYGKIEKGDVVCMLSGWSSRFVNAERYRNADVNGHMNFPTIHPDAADVLRERGVAGIGVDTFSPDRDNGTFEVHRSILGADKFIIENLTNLDRLPAKGAVIIALPLKIAAGTETPLRVVALVPKEKK